MGKLKVGLGIPHSGWNFEEVRAVVFSRMVADWVHRSGSPGALRVWLKMLEGSCLRPMRFMC